MRTPGEKCPLPCYQQVSLATWVDLAEGSFGLTLTAESTRVIKEQIGLQSCHFQCNALKMEEPSHVRSCYICSCEVPVMRQFNANEGCSKEIAIWRGWWDEGVGCHLPCHWALMVPLIFNFPCDLQNSGLKHKLSLCLEWLKLLTVVPHAPFLSFGIGDMAGGKQTSPGCLYGAAIPGCQNNPWESQAARHRLAQPLANLIYDRVRVSPQPMPGKEVLLPPSVLCWTQLRLVSWSVA